MFHVHIDCIQLSAVSMLWLSYCLRDQGFHDLIIVWDFNSCFKQKGRSLGVFQSRDCDLVISNHSSGLLWGSKKMIHLFTLAVTGQFPPCQKEMSYQGWESFSRVECIIQTQFNLYSLCFSPSLSLYPTSLLFHKCVRGGGQWDVPRTQSCPTLGFSFQLSVVCSKHS